MIASNIAGVIRRVDELQRRMERTLLERVARLPWADTAGGAMMAAANPDEAQLVSLVLATFRSGVQSGRFVATLRGPAGALSRLRSAVRSGSTDAELEDVVVEWVNAPYTGRDDPASGKDLTAAEHENPDIAVQALYRILNIVPISAAELQSAERQDAARRLEARIEEFLEATGRSDTASAARVRILFDAVSAAWKTLAREDVPRLAREVVEDILESRTLAPGA